MANKAYRTKISKAVQNIGQGTGPAEECNSLENTSENSLSQRLLIALLILLKLKEVSFSSSFGRKL